MVRVLSTLIDIIRQSDVAGLISVISFMPLRATHGPSFDAYIDNYKIASIGINGDSEYFIESIHRVTFT